MANFCSNIYHFVFSDKEKAEKFLDFVSTSDNDKDKGLLYQLSIKTNKNATFRDVIKIDKIRDVGERVTYAYRLSLTAPKIGVTTDSKWTPCPNAWNDIAKTFDENVIVYYETEEPDCGIYASNDPDYVGHYVIDVCDDIDLPDDLPAGHPHTYGETVSVLQELLGTYESDLSALLYILKNSEYGNSVFVHEITYSSISDWSL